MARCICPVTISLLSVLYLVEGKELYETETDYNKNVPPGGSDNHTEVSVSLFINRVSAVDENKEEITLDLFMQVYWQDARVKISNASNISLDVIELTWQEQRNFWVPDLYIRQLREMKVLSLFQEMTSVRLYKNQTMRVSIGATVIIKCDMDFVLYPLDIQKCAVDFSSYKYTMNEMTFKWRDDPPLSFPSDFGDDGFRLAKYVVSFTTEKDMHVVFYGEGNHSTARMLITMSREIRSHLLESYLPSTLFVIMSWGSFVVIPEIVPGRMVLLVTTLLSLVTMFDTVRNNSPNALELKCIEVWLISCTLFVFFALLEYFVVLFGIRYEKHWRHKKRDFERMNATLAAVGGPSGSHSPAPGTIQHLSQKRIAQRGLYVGQLPPLLQHRRTSSHATANNVSVLQDRNGGGGGRGREGGIGGGRAEGLGHLGTSKVSPRRDEPVRTSIPPAETIEGSGEEFAGRRRFRMVAEYVILYCGSQRGMLDQVSLALFPISFLLFTTVYWISYLTESQRQRNN